MKPKLVSGTLILTFELDLDNTTIIIHTITVYDPRVFHDYDLDPRSHLRVQGNNAYVAKVHIRIIFSVRHIDSLL